MSSVNIRTINGAKHNGHLPAHLQRVQNRAAAVLDAWIAIDESCSFDIVAHLHRISIDQIEKDLYGDITDLRKRFGKSLKKFQGAIQQCVTEIEGGINPALVAVAHHIPFSLLHDIQNTKDVQQSINNFFLNIAAPNPREEQTTNTDSDFTIDTVNVSQFICTFTINNEFCSCCVLRSIIKNIHINSNNPCKSFRELSQASAVSMAQQITNLSSNFISGRQEDPSEFLLVLLDHLAQCLSCSDSPSYSTHSTNPIHLIFGITIESSIKCTQCLNDSVQKNYESIWTIPIILYSSVEEAISAFCSTEDIGGDDLFTCSQCQRNVIALKTTQIIDASPVICIQLKRFIYDKEAKNIRKVKKYISYPEILDLTSCISKEILQSDKENCQINQFIYQLNAVVVHIGETVNSGHIHSYIKSPDALWYKADDELITKIDLSKVLADNDSYILFYTKFTNEKIIQWESQCSTPFKKSSNLILSSTPAHLGEQSLETFDDDTTIAKNFTLNISRIDDELQTEVSTDDNRNSTINSLNIHENTCNSNAPLKHAIPLQTHLFQEDIAEAIEVQTESRIEIIPRKNLNSEHSNCLMSSGPSRSSLKFETPHSGVSTKKQVVFVNDFSESSIDSTLHDISSEMSTVSPQNISNQDVQDNDNFHIQLSSSYQFKLEPIDLVRLKSIQTTKLKKKHDRMCEAMGLFLGFNDKPRKKIFLSKEAKETSSSVNNSAIGSVVLNNGNCHINVTNTTIVHPRGYKICRPIREPIRSLIKKQFSAGASVYRLHKEYLQKRTSEQIKGYNYDGIGRSRDIFTKIKSENVNEALLASDVDEAIHKLHERFKNEINISGKVQGAIQVVSKHPCQIIVFPGKPFPRPKIVLSDRAQVFLTGALRIWNNESLKDFLNRAFRIVNGNADYEDLQKTNVHACIAHVLLDIRKTINKYIDEEYQELCMWSIALLINTSTWSEFKEKWKLFCIVFLQLYAANGVTHKDNKDILLQKIRDIKSDPNTVDAIKLTERIRDVNGTITSNIYSYQSGDEEENDGDELNNWPSRLTKPKVRKLL
ncbi:unnamed protein product [Rotaria sp. Silwood2]|nr:unnamed protein product [Rotaria sp. Silwood2]